MHSDYIDRKRPLTLEDIGVLRELIGERIDPSLMALKLKRSEEDVRAKAAELGRALGAGDAGQAEHRPM
jgi:hypothetical protein